MHEESMNPYKLIEPPIKEPSQMRIAIVLFTNLGIGAGTEVVATSLAKCLSSSENYPRLNVTIFQTDYMYTSSTNPVIKESVLDRVDVITLRSPFNSRLLRYSEQATTLLPLLRKVLVSTMKPIVYIIANHSILKDTARRLDAVLLLNAYDAIPWHFVLPELPIIISGECGYPNPTDGVLRKISMSILTRISKGAHFVNRGQYELCHSVRSVDFILPNGVSADLFVPVVHSEQRNLTKVLFVSRLDRGKGIVELLNAFSHLKQNNSFKLTVVGNGEFRNLVMNIKTVNIDYLGFVEHDRLPGVYSANDIFVFPSVGEGFGNVVLEALSCGLFCLVSKNLQGIFDEFESMGALRYIDITPDAIANELSAHEGYRLSKETKLKVHEYIKENYDWPIIAHKMLSHIRTIINK